MDIRVMMKNICTQVSDRVRLVLKTITGKRLHIMRLSPGWTSYHIGGLVVGIVCVGLLACLLKHKYCMRKNLAKSSLKQSSLEQSALGQSALGQSAPENDSQEHGYHEREESSHDTTALEALELKVTATVEMLEKLEQKIDVLVEKQSAEKSAEVAATIKQEVSRQVSQIDKKKKVLSKLMAEVSDGK